MGRRDRLTPEQKYEIAELYRKGVKVEAIAIQCNVGKTHVTRIAQRFGIPVRNPKPIRTE